MLELAKSLGREEAHELVTKIAWRTSHDGENLRALMEAEPAVVGIMDEQQVGELLQADFLIEAEAEVGRMVERARRALPAQEPK